MHRPSNGTSRLRPPAKLGPMPTQEASANRRTTQCTHAEACVGSCLCELSPLCGTSPNDHLPHPRAARRASTLRQDRAGGRRRAASSESCSEGAAAERERFLAVLAGCAGCAPRDLEFTRVASECGAASCMSGRVAARCEPSARAGPMTASCPVRYLRFESLRALAARARRVRLSDLFLRRGRDSNPRYGCPYT